MQASTPQLAIIGRALERYSARGRRLVLEDPRAQLIADWPWDGARDEQLAADIWAAAQDWADGVGRDGSCQLTAYDAKDKRLGGQPLRATRRDASPATASGLTAAKSESALIVEALLQSHRDMMGELRQVVHVTLTGVAQLAQANASAIKSLGERLNQAEIDRATAVRAGEAALASGTEAVAMLEVERSKSAKVDRLLKLVEGSPVVRELTTGGGGEKPSNG